MVEQFSFKESVVGSIPIIKHKKERLPRSKREKKRNATPQGMWLSQSSQG